MVLALYIFSVNQKNTCGRPCSHSFTLDVGHRILHEGARALFERLPQSIVILDSVCKTSVASSVRCSFVWRAPLRRGLVNVSVET